MHKTSPSCHHQGGAPTDDRHHPSPSAVHEGWIEPRRPEIQAPTSQIGWCARTTATASGQKGLGMSAMVLRFCTTSRQRGGQGEKEMAGHETPHPEERRWPRSQHQTAASSCAERDGRFISRASDEVSGLVIEWLGRRWATRPASGLPELLSRWLRIDARSDELGMLLVEGP